MENCIHTSKTFSEMAGGGCIVYPSSYPLDPPLAISYKNHQKSLAYFSHLEPLILLFFTIRQSQKGRMAPPLHTLQTALHLFCDMILIEKESTIAFSAIDKSVAL